jgi:formylglycine-generating enzyme
MTRPINLTNSIGMKFVWINPGSFMMGSPNEEKEREPFGTDESEHKVTLTKGFYMGVYAVTQEEWLVVMGYNPSVFKGDKTLPVETVSWDDCQTFVRKLRDKDNNDYRLPSESEWEYACRAGTTTPFYFGETISTDQANYNGEIAYGNGQKGSYRRKTMPVGSFAANAWGLNEMHANVWEWCFDWYGAYPQHQLIDPTGPESGEKRVLRGGSWGNVPGHCRSACRAWNVPGGKMGGGGFRVCFFE